MCAVGALGWSEMLIFRFYKRGYRSDLLNEAYDTLWGKDTASPNPP